jgi:glycerol uptake facilitator protein
MSPFIAEIIGTMLLMLLGNGIVANVLLNNTKGNESGWVVITLGWGFAVFAAVVVAGPYSGAHINPAVTIGLAAGGLFPWEQVPGYIAAQMIGAIIGTTLVLISYYDHYRDTPDKRAKLATFCTAPAIRNYPLNFISELIATFVLVFVVFYIAGPTFSSSSMSDVQIGLGSVGALPVGLLVIVIGMGLGGPTGYSINPARDLGPRIAHYILPVPSKGSSDWEYSWVPTLGPIAGGLVAAFLYLGIS